MNAPMPYRCSRCNQHFVSRSNVKRHMRNVHGIEMGVGSPYYFHQPSGTYPRQKRHTSRASGQLPYPFPCDECGQSYASKSGLKRHRSTVHGIGGSKYTCDECDRRFPCTTTLGDHVQRDHRGIPLDKKWKCTRCVSSFTRRSSLNYHTRTLHGGSSSHTPQ